MAKYIDWINKTILDNGGMSSCGYTIAAVQTADTTDTIEASASITATTSPTTNIAKKVFFIDSHYTRVFVGKDF